MKTTTFASRIEAAISATLQSDLPSDEAVACVNRLLSAFKEIGYAQHQETWAIDPQFIEDDVIYS